MTRRVAVTLVTLGVAVAAILAPTLAGASGGGGCGGPVTDRVGARIAIRNFCFGPTVLRVHRGRVVTFVNRDDFEHTVMGANASWGSFMPLRGGHDVRYRFTRPGVYPYVCTYHAGMVGAVVVGGGVPHTSSKATTAAGPVVRVRSKPETQPAEQVVATSPVSPPSSPRSAAIAGAIAIGASLLSVGTLTRRRRARRVPAA